MSLLADSIIDWGALAQVAYISAFAGIAIASVLGLGIVSELRAQDAQAGGASALGLRVVTVVCVLIVAAAVVVGIYYIADK
jgi:uncharacterized membrane protein YbhN (UPF0104 family)